MKRLKDVNIGQELKSALKDKMNNNIQTNKIELGLADFPKVITKVKREYLNLQKKKVVYDE